MCSKKKSKLCQQLIEQYSKRHNMNTEILNNILSRVIQLMAQDGKSKDRGKITSARFKHRRTRLESKKPTEDRKNRVFSYKLRRALKWNNAPKIQKIPIVVLNDVLTTQGRISKSDFMDYFGLELRGGATQNHSVSLPNFGMTKFSQAVNIPISSDLGIRMAKTENHVVQEDFKIRKITRSEWYINKPYDKKQDTTEYPVTYVDRSPKNSPSSCVSKTRNGIRNMDNLLKLCKQSRVIVERLDLLQIQKKLRKRANPKKSVHQYRLRKKCRNVKVLVSASEKKTVDHYLKKKSINNNS